MPGIMIIMGSASDWDKMRPALRILNDLGLEYEVTVSSAHRTPERTGQIMREAEGKGVKVYICAAGMAAHLAGAVAARTIRPVIGVPIAGTALAGMDALYSTVQMPSGFPVATVALDGARNAAWLAAQILAVGDDALARKLEQARERMRRDVESAARQIEAEGCPGRN